MLYRTLRQARTTLFEQAPPVKQKCCRYDQNGQPMQPKRVDDTFQLMGDLMAGWSLNDTRTRLLRYFFLEDYQQAVRFIAEVAKLDRNTTRNCPSFTVQRGEMMTLELYSPPLDGLSMVDFELAMAINNLKFRDFYLIPLTNPLNYRAEVTAYRMRAQSQKIQDELQRVQ